MHRLSIVTVNLNNSFGLQETIDSVVGQTFVDYEWIVIDGGSTDGSLQLIEHSSEHFSYWVSEPDNGIYSAMNKGIAVSRGEWILFLNSGDTFCNDSVLENVFAKKHSADILYGDVILMDNNIIKGKEIYPEPLPFSQLYWKSICHNSTFIRRALFKGKKYNENNKIVSDWEFFMEKSLENVPFEHLAMDVCSYDTSGVSSKDRGRVLDERSQVINRLVPDCIKIDMDELYKYKSAFADEQLNTIHLFRNQSRNRHRLVTLFVYFIRLLAKLSK